MSYVIVVDDDEMLAGMLCDLLAAKGHTAAHYRTAELLRQRMMFRRPDAVLLERSVADGSGMEALADIRSDPRLAGIPVIMMMAGHEQSALLAALRAGASDYMTKPFLPAELLARVDGVLAARAAIGGQGSPA